MKKIFGIDLGTTNSLIALHNNDKTTIIPDRNGNKILPSFISFMDNNSSVVGKRAKELSRLNPQRSIFSIKRFMGLTASEAIRNSEMLPYELVDEDNNIKIKVDNERFSPQELSALILKELKKQAEEYTGEELHDVVITVPAYFNDNQRSATQLAAKLADMNPVKIINEPTAAALAYGLNKKKNETVLVYDLGGGTFDVSILKLQSGIFEVLSTNGNTRLGGDDIDEKIIDFFIDNTPIRKNELNQDEIDRLRKIAIESKHRLSRENSLEISYQLKSNDYKIKLDRKQFKDLISNIINMSLKSVRKALKDAELDKSDIDDIVLVGGSTRNVAIREAIKEFFGKEALSNINPDEVVATGAAIQAAILAGEISETVLLDVTPLSLGMETMGSVVEKFILRNSKIPCEVTETFTTAVDGQTAVSVHILQGERELAEDNISLGKFILDDIEPMAAGIPRINVTFKLDQNGLLNVSAKNMNTGTSQHITVQPSNGLTDEIVEKMLHDSIFNAKEDFEKRILIDKKTEAKAIILSSERALDENAKLLTQDEHREILGSIEKLKDTVQQSNDKKEIESEIDQLDIKTQNFAEKIMNQTIKSALENKRTEDIV